MTITIGQIARMYADWKVRQDPSLNWHEVHYLKHQKLLRKEVDSFDKSCVEKFGPAVAGQQVWLASVQDPETKFKEQAIFSLEADAMDYVSKTIKAFVAKHGREPRWNSVFNHHIDAHTNPTHAVAKPAPAPTPQPQQPSAAQAAAKGFADGVKSTAPDVARTLFKSTAQIMNMFNRR